VLPQDPGAVKGYAELLRGCQELFDQLCDDYYAFVDMHEWKGAALDLLTEMAKDTTSMKYELNPLLTEGFTDLLAMYVRLFLLINKIDGRNSLLVLFTRSYFHVYNKEDEPSFPL